MSRKRHRTRALTILDLPFKSILDERPAQDQFILLAWEINGYSGYESTYWDIEDIHCQHAVAWLPLGKTQLFSKACAVKLKRLNKLPILKWSHHFSVLLDKKYVSKAKLPKAAESI